MADVSMLDREDQSKGPIDYLGCRVAKDPFGTPVEGLNLTIGSHGNDGVDGGIEDSPVPSLARPKRLFGSLSLGDILAHTDGKLRPAIRIPDERHDHVAPYHPPIFSREPDLDLVAVLDPGHKRLKLFPSSGDILLVHERQEGLAVEFVLALAQ